MDLSGIVDSFALPGGLSVTRRAAGTVSGGIYAVGATSSLHMQGIAYPARARELRLLPEGQRTGEAFAFVTRDALRGAMDPSGAPPDRVTYGGIVYEVQAVTNWGTAAGYYLAVATKVPS